MKRLAGIAAAIMAVLTFGALVFVAVYFGLKSDPVAGEPHTCSAEYQRNGVKFTITWDDPRECKKLIGP